MYIYIYLHIDEFAVWIFLCSSVLLLFVPPDHELLKLMNSCFLLYGRES